MLEGKSSDFKTLILLRIVKKLIENTDSYGIHKLGSILSKEVVVTPSKMPQISREELEKEREYIAVIKKEKIKENVRDKLKMTPSVKIDENNTWIEPQDRPSLNRPAPVQNRHRRMPIQQSAIQVPKKGKLEYNDSLPPHLRYLKPTPTLKRVGMDLGELNPYLEDPNVDSIEVEGENEKVFVIGKMGKKPTSLVLSKEEIDSVIDRFSKEAKIPKVEGLFKVSVNNLILTAMVSNVISSRFIIKKIRI